MIVVKVAGGLGNQMFNYAFAKFLQKRGHKVVVDVSFVVKNAKNNFGGGGIRKFEFNRFSLTLPLIIESKPSITMLRFHGFPTRYIVYKKLYHFTPKPLRKLLFSWWDKRIVKTITECDIAHIDETFAHQNRTFICEGYFFSYYYVREVQAEILEDFRLAYPLSGTNAKIHQQIASTPDSVFLHVRRGDYLLAQNAHFIVLDGVYYERALRHIKQSLPNAHIFVFSNDMPWCRAHFLDSISAEVREGLEFSFIEGNDEANAIEEMELMSACRHAIIANSTFSWWAAYRIANPQRIVIAPDRTTIDWDKERNKAFYPPNWVLLEV
ncbi:alpha-1,2-fucosyltransferase [uncultured Helicobacter sp.]|uniref:alpha-1,2-fucosyltransferase n=1 Tax=uncultured Helicobacter sp. TaxID=175537 RepID=UPI00374E3734